MVESEEELTSLLMRVKEESDKADLKLNSEKTNIMVYSHISSWQKGGETMETVSDFIFLGSKINADGDCSHKIKRHLLLGRKAMTNPDSVLESRDITLVTKSQTRLRQQHTHSFLYDPSLISVHDYWKNHSFDYTDFCRQSNVSAF